MKVWKNVGSTFQARMRALVLAALVVAVVSVTGQAAFAEAPTIPSTGIDVAGYVGTAITTLGTVLAACVGGFFAFLLVKIGIKWASGLLRRA